VDSLHRMADRHVDSVHRHLDREAQMQQARMAQQPPQEPQE